MMPLPAALLRVLDEGAFDPDFGDAVVRRLAGLADFDVFREVAAFDAVDLDLLELAFFAESLVEDAFDDDAFGFVVEVFAFDAAAVFEPPDFRAEGFEALFAELDLELEDFFVVAIIFLR